MRRLGSLPGALVAGVADDGGFGFAIAKALAEAGASVCVGTWPPALGIFETLLRRNKMEDSLKFESGEGKLQFERVYPLDADYDEDGVEGAGHPPHRQDP